MAFPTLSNITISTETSDVTTHDVTLPATVNSGDLLVVLGAIDNVPVVTRDDSTAGTWTTRYDEDQGTNVKAVCYLKKADGTEDGAVLQPTTSTGQRSSWITFRVPVGEWSGTLSEVETAQNAQSGTGTDVDPPNLTAGVGSGDNTWVAIANWDSNKTISGWSETDNQTQTNNSTTNGANVAISTYDGAAASSRNPSAYTLSASEQRIGATMVIPPSTGKSANVTLADIDGSARVSLSGISWAWYDALPATGVSPTDTGTDSTDASGNFSVTLTGTTLNAGQTGYLLLDNGAYQGIYAVIVS